MRSESWVAKGVRVVMALGVLASWGQAVRNLPGTVRVVDALAFGKRVSCAVGVSSSSGWPDDLSLVFGSGTDLVEGKATPNPAGRGRLAGGARDYLARRVPRIVILGDARGLNGVESSGKEWLMKNFAVPEEAIVVVPGNMVNTAEEAAAAAKIAKEIGARRAVIPASRSNADRATQLTCNNGLAAWSWVAYQDGAPGIFERAELAATAIEPYGRIPIFFVKDLGLSKTRLRGILP